MPDAFDELADLPGCSGRFLGELLDLGYHNAETLAGFADPLGSHVPKIEALRKSPGRSIEKSLS